MPGPPPERVAAVVVAAGRGERIGAPEKVLLPLAGRPMLFWPLRALERAVAVGVVVVVAGEHTREAIGRLVRDEGFAKVAAVVAGGERRQDSVAAGLVALPEGIEIVVIHDGARPMIESDLIDRCAETAAASGAAIAAIPVADTLKRVVDEAIVGTVDRAGLWAAQTPQAFRLDVLRRAMAAGGGATVTDEAGLIEAAGIPVAVVPGSPTNLKVTRWEDIALADALLQGRSDARSQVTPVVPRIGIGYDTHRLVEGRRLVLGGVEIPYCKGLAGHSDADALLHAIADAVLGAAALGDIGHHFPPIDDRFRDADSQELLRLVVGMARGAGWVPGNVDATILAEAPRIAPHVPLMRERIAACLGIDAGAVSVKASTNEGMGSFGRGEGIAALATVILVAAPPAFQNS